MQRWLKYHNLLRNHDSSLRQGRYIFLSLFLSLSICLLSLSLSLSLTFLSPSLYLSMSLLSHTNVSVRICV